MGDFAIFDDSVLRDFQRGEDTMHMDEILGLTQERWVANPTSKTDIIGFWTEDGTEYQITVPHQLRDKILLMQNALVERQEEIERLRALSREATDSASEMAML